MRILLLHQLYELRGGAARVLFGLEDALVGAGDEVAVIAAATEDRATARVGSTFHGVPGFRRVDFERATLARRVRWAISGIYSTAARDVVRQVVRAFAPDAAIVLKPEYQLSMSVLAELKALRVPVVQWLVDYKPWCTQGQFYNTSLRDTCTRCAGGVHLSAVRYRCDRGSLALSTYGALARTVTTSILKIPLLADVFVVPGEVNRRMLCRLTGMSMGRVLTIPHPMQVSSFSPGSGTGPGNLLFFGGIGPLKGLWTLARALTELPGEQLDVAGVDDYGLADSFMKYAAELGVADRINLDTRIRMGPELQDRIRMARLVIVPSDWADTLEYALLESMALGKATVVSNAGANGGFVTHGKDGLVFERANAEDLARTIREGLARPSRLEAIGRNARQTVERRLTRERFYSALVQAVEHATDQARTGRG